MQSHRIKAEDILATYVHFRDEGRAGTLPLTETFWQDMAAGKLPELAAGRLMTAFTFAQPWSMWERHPAGEELVMLLAGHATVVLEDAGGERAVTLDRPGTYVLVPRSVWHTARATEATTMLFLTPGAGTEHRPVDA